MKVQRHRSSAQSPSLISLSWPPSFPRVWGRYCINSVKSVPRDDNSPPPANVAAPFRRKLRFLADTFKGGLALFSTANSLVLPRELLEPRKVSFEGSLYAPIIDSIKSRRLPQQVNGTTFPLLFYFPRPPSTRKLRK